MLSRFFTQSKPKESTIDSESESDTSDFLYQLMNSIVKNPQSLSNAIEKLNKSDITNFLINILHEIDTDEFRNNLSIIFNNETIMDTTFHIFQTFFTSAKKKKFCRESLHATHKSNAEFISNRLGYVWYNTKTKKTE